MVRRSRPRGGLRQQDSGGKQRQHQAETRRQDSVKRRVVLEVDCPRECFKPHERHGPEVAKGVQSGEQRPGGYGGPQQGQGYPTERAPGGMSQAA